MLDLECTNWRLKPSKFQIPNSNCLCVGAFYKFSRKRVSQVNMLVTIVFRKTAPDTPDYVRVNDKDNEDYEDD